MKNSIIRKALRESISNLLLNEAFKSNRLRNFFKAHGGVKKDYPNHSLGDINDAQILYFREFDSQIDAISERRRLLRSNNGIRSNYDMSCLFEIYVANDGCTLLVGIDRKTINTIPTWASEKEEKVGKRYWRQQSFDKYDDTPKYYYSEKGVGPDFGLRTNVNYAGMLSDLKNKRERFNDFYGENADEEWRKYREKELQHAKDYVKAIGWRGQYPNGKKPKYRR